MQASLLAQLRTGRLPHLLIFAGHGGEGEAKELVSKLIGTDNTHPDLHRYHPEGKSGLHSIQSMRELIEQVYLPPYQADYKIFLVYEAHRMPPSSSNALLKTFEEPPSRTVILLLTEKPSALLPTICSRGQMVRFAQQRTSTPLQERFLKNFPSIDGAFAVAKEIEEEKKKEEKELRGLLPGNLTPLQKEQQEKEIQGIIALYAQEKALSLLEAVHERMRDLYLLRLQGPKEFLFDQKLTDSKTRLPPYPYLMQKLKEAKLGIERSLKLDVVLEGLLLALS